MEAGSDSDVPEELMAQEGIKQDEEIRKVPRENIIRVAQEGKERRRQWAQRKPQLKSSTEHTIEVKETEQHQEATYISGMLPSNIVEALAAHEKIIAPQSCIFKVQTFALIAILVRTVVWRVNLQKQHIMANLLVRL
ncbi:uncharacterized protein [Elaeis guineensis]|uniref:uncharacterized protein n=1 Tax=Elaeis guineensis var. tenera TaxID=51953 RepID=UPI003C6D3663